MTLPLSASMPVPDRSPIPGRVHGVRTIPVSDVVREYGLRTLAALPDPVLRGLFYDSMTRSAYSKLLRVVRKRRASITLLIGEKRMRGVDRGRGVRITEAHEIRKANGPAQDSRPDLTWVAKK